jgi:hypothetical protein
VDPSFNLKDVTFFKPRQESIRSTAECAAKPCAATIEPLTSARFTKVKLSRSKIVIKTDETAFPDLKHVGGAHLQQRDIHVPIVAISTRAKIMFGFTLSECGCLVQQ